jgi:predicted DNA-binding protein
MSTLSLKWPDSLLLRLDQESRQRRMTKSAMVRAALEREVEQPETVVGTSCYDLARDLAGSIKKLPKDLATNPKYMEGFGRHGNKVMPVPMPED